MTRRQYLDRLSARYQRNNYEDKTQAVVIQDLQQYAETYHANEKHWFVKAFVMLAEGKEVPI